MRKILKISLKIVLIILFLIVILTMWVYYKLPLLRFSNVEGGDELLKNGKAAYIIRKDKYERGDIIAVNDINWKYKKAYQVSRKIVGLPGEFVEEGGVSLEDGQYAVRSSVTNGELTSTFRDVVPAANIYGVIVGKPLADFGSIFSYFIDRTLNIPEYLRSKRDSSYLSLVDREVKTEAPEVIRKIAVINRNKEGFAVEYFVGAGNNLWNVIEEELMLRHKSMTERELTAEVDRIKDELKYLPADELEEFGFSSGNVGILRSGDRIKILSIMERYGN